MSKSKGNEPFVIGEKKLTVDDVVAVARHFRQVKLGEIALKRMALSRAIVDYLVEDTNEKVYGLTTGFGSLRDISICREDASKLSENLIMSHASGVGEPFAEDVLRAVMLLRVTTLAKGNSGCSIEMVQTLIDMLNNRVYPYVPQQGSVGSSGDLAPLSHLILLVMGHPLAKLHVRCMDSNGIEPDGKYVGKPCKMDFISIDEWSKTATDTAELGFKPVRLKAKDGLAGNNGAVFTAALLALSVHDARVILDTADLGCALSFEALQAVPDCLNDGLVGERPYKGHLESVKNIKTAIEGSSLVATHGSFNLGHYNQAVVGLYSLKGEHKDIADLWELMVNDQTKILKSMDTLGNEINGSIQSGP